MICKGKNKTTMISPLKKNSSVAKKEGQRITNFTCPFERKGLKTHSYQKHPRLTKKDSQTNRSSRWISSDHRWSLNYNL